jgi:hypothetical protein
MMFVITVSSVLVSASLTIPNRVRDYLGAKGGREGFRSESSMVYSFVRLTFLPFPNFWTGVCSRALGLTRWNEFSELMKTRGSCVSTEFSSTDLPPFNFTSVSLEVDLEADLCSFIVMMIG